MLPRRPSTQRHTLRELLRLVPGLRKSIAAFHPTTGQSRAPCATHCKATRGVVRKPGCSPCKTRGAVEWCRRQTPKKTLRLQKSKARKRGKDPFARPMPPGLSDMGWGRGACSTRSEPPSVPRVRADFGGRLFTAKFGVIVHYLPHQIAQSLAGGSRHLLHAQCPPACPTWGGVAARAPLDPNRRQCLALEPTSEVASSRRNSAS